MADETPAEQVGRHLDRFVALPQVDRVHLAQEGQGLVHPEFTGAGHESPDVLGQAAAAEADPGAQELLADPVVVADRLGQLGDVATGGVTQLGHGVDEADLGGQEAVGGHLDQLRRRMVGEQPRDPGGQQLGVALVQEFASDFGAVLVVRQTVDDAVRVHGVGHRETLAQELRVPHHDQVVAGLVAEILDVPGCPHRYGRLAGDHRGALRGVDVLDERLDGSPHVAEVGGVASCQLRCADGDEMDLRLGDAARISGELQSSAGQLLVEQFGEPRLVEGRHARVERGDLRLVHVKPDHLVPQARHTGRVDRAQVATADDRYAHAGQPNRDRVDQLCLASASWTAESKPAWPTSRCTTTSTTIFMLATNSRRW